jgi:hypothetical protein
MVQLVSYLLCLTGALGGLAYLARGSGWRLGLTLLVLLQGGLTLLVLRGSDEPESPRGLPVIRRDDGTYATSSACRSCHPGEYASWHRSFHRSMTEPASERTLRAPWTGVRLGWRERSYELYRKGAEFWVSLPDPALTPRTRAEAAQVPSVARRVVMTTGSHHYQAYWLQGERGNELLQFPFVYHFESQRFIPRQDAFLDPPDAPQPSIRWNSNCIQCHSVGGEPRHDLKTDRFETSVAELGIACEACHGPAAAHVRQHQNPIERYARQLDDTPDPSVVNPARLPPAVSSEVCGQCHAYFVPKDTQKWWQTGFSGAYTPGDELAQSRLILQYEAEIEREDPLISASLESIFFPDGTIRVGGREYNGLVRSACYERAAPGHELGCLTCHELHGETPADQLKAEAAPGARCLDCHSKVGDALEAHTHHPKGSSGSNCYNCHMPYTTYALFKGIRSHRITSPNATRAQAFSTLNACNLCHLDRSLTWTAAALERWYGQPAPKLEAAEAELPHAVIGLLRGNAATRVLTAYGMGWDLAQAASGKHWQAALLAELLDDPYSAVRFVAHRSLQTLPGFRGYAYDFLAPRAVRQKQRDEVRRLALGRGGGPSAFIVEQAVVRQQLSLRDDTPISISE